MNRIAVVLVAAGWAVSACGGYGAWAKRREARELQRSIAEKKGQLAAMSPEALERAEAESRERAIAQYEKILREYADVGREEMDEALYLLARLLFDREQQEFQRKQREFESARAAAQAAGRPSPEEPRPRYPGSKAVYERLLREFPDSSLREDALYDFAYILFEEGSYREAVYVFDTLVRERPRSRYAPEVHFRLGEYAFEALDLASAEQHYREVLRFGQTDLTEKALFKLAWVYYNANRFDEAKTVLADLLDREAARVQREGREFAPTPILFFPGPRRPTIRELEKKGTELYQETLEIVARVFAESGGVEDLLRFVRSRQTGDTPPPYAAPLLHRLALVQKERSEFEAAARTYQRLLETYPTFRDAPRIEQEYVDVLLESKDFEAAARVRAGMLEKYDSGTPWARANPEEEVRRAALAAARKALAWAIRYHHARGLERQQQAGGVPEDLRRAISLYEKYLRRFPDGKASYDKRFRYAQALFAAGEHRHAIELFRQVAFDEHFAHRREEAAFARVLSVEEVVKQSTHPLPKPLLAEVVAAYEDYIHLNPRSEKAPPLLYKEGQLYLEAREFDRAVDTFRRLVREYATHPLAGEAQAWIAQSELERGRFAEAEAAARVALDAAAQGGPLGERRAELEDLYALAIFRQGERAIEEKRPLEARDHFLRLVDRVPRSRAASRALYNAAVATEEAGRFDEAAELYERLLSDYAESDFASDAAVRLARSYEGRPEGSAALIRIYERVADFHVDHPNAEEFLFRAAQLAAKENRGFEAQRLFEKYLARYRTPEASGPRLERLRTALFQLGSSYAEAGAVPLARLTLEQFLALPPGADSEREDQRFARARAELLLARMSEKEYRAVRIEPPLEPSFRRKERLLAEVVER
jgi:TolA-binding protein